MSFADLPASAMEALCTKMLAPSPALDLMRAEPRLTFSLGDFEAARALIAQALEDGSDASILEQCALRDALDAIEARHDRVLKQIHGHLEVARFVEDPDFVSKSEYVRDVMQPYPLLDESSRAKKISAGYQAERYLDGDLVAIARRITVNDTDVARLHAKRMSLVAALEALLKRDEVLGATPPSSLVMEARTYWLHAARALEAALPLTSLDAAQQALVLSELRSATQYAVEARAERARALEAEAVVPFPSITSTGVPLPIWGITVAEDVLPS